VQWPALIALLTGIIGLGGIVFTALRFRRDDATAIVSQQTAILGNMKQLNDELRISIANIRQERDDLKLQVAALEGKVDELRKELGKANDRLTAAVDKIQTTLDDGR
jgi:uncharacterized coiled-coil DUF342 family protein